jgi:hypothetical protein
MANSIFRKQSLDRVNSPEQLNDYIKTSSTNVWLTISAVLILIVSFFVWMFFGALDTTVTVDGVSKNNSVICFTDNVGEIKVNQKVRLGEVTGTVLSVSKAPLSLEDATALANTDEYTLYRLELSTWNYVVEISLDGSVEDGYVSADIVVEEISPVNFVFG